MKLTIQDVAQKAGVSKTTVSRILNGNYAQTSEETTRKVLETIRELDYRPNALAQGLKSMRTRVIGIMLSNLQNPFWMRVLEGVEDTCRSSQYHLMISNSNESADLEEEHVRGYQMRKVDGILVNPTMQNRSVFESLQDTEFPMVVLNRRLDKAGFHSIQMDNELGASLAVEHLVRLGRTRIAAFVYNNSRVSTWTDRIRGYRKAMERHGFGPDRISVVETEQDGASVKEKTMALCRVNPPDAILSTNNMMTLDILEGIKESGLRIPQDIALIGYDETAWARHLEPPLTTVSQPAYEMGKLAAETLIKLIEGNRKPRAKTIMLRPELVVRRSCGAELTRS